MTRKTVAAALAGALLLLGSLGLPEYLERRRLHGLRPEPEQALSPAAVARRLQDLDFFEANRNPAGRGVEHDYELQAGGRVVFDGATGLYWQREGSTARLRFDQAQQHVARLNAERFGGFSDWRLPTLEEAMSLMEPEPRAGLHLDPIFGQEPWWIWTADRESVVGVWVVYFYGGNCFVHVPLGGSTYARAVRRPA